MGVHCCDASTWEQRQEEIQGQPSLCETVSNRRKKRRKKRKEEEKGRGGKKDEEEEEEGNEGVGRTECT